jgi:choline dehydrogenase-like flavoprotein
VAEAYDVIVVGGGSAGCVVAAELAREAGLRVLLLEGGDPGEKNPETLVADGYKYAFANDRLMFDRFTVPQQSVGGRRLFAGTGRGMGGSGAINAMVYTRGDARDYAEWPEGWRWADVVPDFEALEARLHVRPRPPTEFTEVAIAAAEAAGFARKEDLNDGALSGFLGYEQMNYEGAARRSSYVSFIKAPGRPETLTIETNARARRVLVDGAGEERRAHGVEYVVGGVVKTATATREIVLTAGALETPRLLLLSGIGPRAHLTELGIEVVADRAEIGENLHDHPNVTMFHAGQRDIDCFYPQLYGFHRAHPGMPLPAGQADTCYVFYTARSSFHQATLRMAPTIALPPWLYDVAALKHALRWVLDLVLRFPPLARWILRLYGIVVILGKPVSRGTVRLASRDPEAPARIDPRYLSDPRDQEALIAGVKLARQIAAAPALAAWGNKELGPGPRRTSDAALGKWIRDNLMTTFHFCGTCRMGEGESAPVDTRLRLRGVRGLRVADASVMPSTPVSALNAPSMLIGYRAARYIREDLAAAAPAATA